MCERPDVQYCAKLISPTGSKTVSCLELNPHQGLCINSPAARQNSEITYLVFQVRFTERIKLSRQLSKLQKKLLVCGVGADTADIEKEIERVQDDLNVRCFPHHNYLRNTFCYS
jgi:hypothetical protein